MLQRLGPRWIDTASGVEEAARACRDAGRFALDTEADSLHSYFHKVCLIQVSADGSHFLIDPLALNRTALAPLFEVIGDPAVPILMHGADYDIRMLDRDFGARVHGLEDTELMAHLLGEPRTGLATLLERELDISLDKKYQRADWGRRPIPDEMLDYAAADTAFLEPLNARLRQRLEAMGRWEWAVEEFRRMEEIRFHRAAPNPLAFERVKDVRSLRGGARDRAYSLFVWRDQEAQRLDIPPFKVLGNRQLAGLAVTPPTDVRELAARPGLGSRFAHRWGADVLAVLANPSPAPPRQRGQAHRQLDAAQLARLRRFRAARDAAAQELGLEPGLLCPKALLETLATCDLRVREAGDLAACGLEGWRLRCLGAAFAEAMETTPGGDGL
ncbi:MAG: ribonuclease D [Acidobacteria bacterium]|nr:ribonuclease D [Acidobacteriota bacterium]